MTPPGTDGGDGELTDGGVGNLLDGGDMDVLVDGLRGGDGDGVLLVHGVLPVHRGDGDLLVHGLLGGGGISGRLPVATVDGACAVFSIAAGSGEDAIWKIQPLGWGRRLLLRCDLD
jgi:hypothetical protein